MSISASYNSVSQDLTVTGDTVDNTITVSRNMAGTLFVNGGAIAIAGGPATVANTDLIAVSGDLGNDTISLDETHGALPAAELAGGGGNDTLTGGSSADVLEGETGDDMLLGRAGDDLLYGGDDNDTLVGGAGTDQLFGELGNDRMVWNSGDGSDLLEGGDGSDTAEINGGGAGETFTITANGTRVRFDRIDPAPFTLDIGTTESLVLNANGGDDTISTSGNVAALIALTIDGGAGNDTILGGNGADLLVGGDGDDFVDGNQGNDTALLGAGADVYNWDPGDGSDTIEGQADFDTLNFNGSAANEKYELSPNGGRALLNRDVGAIAMDINDVEQITINAGAGTDSVTVHAMNGTDVTGLTVNLASTIGGSTADGAIDTVTLNGSDAKETITLTAGAAGVVTITGLVPAVTVNQIESTDVLSIVAGDGNDVVSAATIKAGIAKVSLDGGAGNDTLTSGGDGVYLGGTGNDTIRAGLTSSSEVLDGGDGVDTLDTTTWDGNYVFNMVTGATNYSGESFINFENVITGAGLDTITGTDGDNTISTQDANDTLNGAGGNDTLKGGAGADTMVGGTGNDVYFVDDAGDVVTENVGEGADWIRASASYVLAAGVEVEKLTTVNSAAITAIDLTGNEFSHTIQGNAGANVLTGGSGADLLDGGDGNDLLRAGSGADVVHGDAGDDRIDLGSALDAADRIDGGANNDTLELNGDYSGGVVFLSATIRSIETIQLDNGDFNFTLNDGNVAAGATLAIDAHSVAGVVVVNAQKELDGSIHFTGGSNSDTLTGGAQADDFDLSFGGSDTAKGRAGNDTFEFGAAFGTSDRIDGGDDNDTVTLDGAYDVTFQSATMVNVERLNLATGHSYKLTAVDGNVAAGEKMIVDGAALLAGSTLNFNASREHDGRYDLRGGADDDILVAGTGGDTLRGRLGADNLTGGAGADTFVYGAAAESNASASDWLRDFDASSDHIDLTFAVSAIDAAVTNVASLAALTSALDAAHLGIHHAALATLTNGHAYLVVETNGVAGYQTNADLVIRVDGATHLGALSTGTFV